MPPRVRITGLGKLFFTTVLHRCTTLNASALSHVLSTEEHLKELFHNGDSVHFDLSNKSHVVMTTKDHIKHDLEIGDERTLNLGKGQVRLQIFHSNFPG